MCSCISRWLAALGLAGCSLAGASAQIVLDGTTGPVRPLSGPTYNILETDGAVRGANLFHSFSQFNLANGDVAEFSGSAGIANVLARVTGPQASNLDGTLRCTIADANFFLMNPNGVVFGQHAQVDVSGAFVVTTAQAIKLTDGGRFDAANPANDLLTVAAPSVFAFLSPNPAGLTVNGAALSLLAGQPLSLVGGNIQIVGGQLVSAQGRINGISVGSPGEIALTADDPQSAVTLSGFTQLGDLTLSGGTLLDVSGSSGGRVVLRGGNVEVDGASVFADTLGAGPGGTVDIEATRLELVNGGVITSDKLSTGDGGLVQISADGVIVDGALTGIGARSLPSSLGGSGGQIVITADSVSLLRGGQISTTTDSSATAGEIDVTANTIVISGEGQLSGILADATTLASGEAGDVTVTTGSLRLQNAGRITAASGGTGNGGQIQVTATDGIVIDGDDGVLFTGIGAPSLNESRPTRTGTVQINAGSLTLLDGGQILASAFGSTDGGAIQIEAGEVVIDRQTALHATGIDARTFGSGQGGGIEINAVNLTLRNGADVTASTVADGVGGDIQLQLSGRLRVESSAAISVSSAGSGNAGQIQAVASGAVQLTDGRISALAENSSGGDIYLESGSQMRLRHSQITAQARLDGGSITLKAAELVYLLDSELSAASVAGNGGNITIDPPFVALSDSLITANAPLGQGGDILVVSAGFLASDSLVTATGLQDGTVEIQSPDVDLTGSLMVLDDALLGADAQLPARCAVRVPGAGSTFVVSGRGGLSLAPTGLLPSFAVDAAAPGAHP